MGIAPVGIGGAPTRESLCDMADPGTKAKARITPATASLVMVNAP
jgi:hypothetical protein